jgi:N-acetyl-gamma-glutamylphosphate reductase
METVPPFIRGKTVVDLSADFGSEWAVYEKWYQKHTYGAAAGVGFGPRLHRV